MPAAYSASTMRHDHNVGRLIGRVRLALLGAVDHKLSPLDLTAAQWTIIVYLAQGLASTPAELATILDCDRGAMTRLLDRLEAKGMIAREPNPTDRRSVSLVLTPTGRQAYPKIQPLVVDVINHFLRDFSAHEVKQLEGLLQRMLESAP